MKPFMRSATLEGTHARWTARACVWTQSFHCKMEEKKRVAVKRKAPRVLSRHRVLPCSRSPTARPVYSRNVNPTSARSKHCHFQFDQAFLRCGVQRKHFIGRNVFCCKIRQLRIILLRPLHVVDRGYGSLLKKELALPLFFSFVLFYSYRRAISCEENPLLSD